MKSIPTRLDRYPAKMVSRLAGDLVARYASDATHLVDPFCGSGAILSAGIQNSLRVSGVDVNPYGALLTRVKLEGFDGNKASQLVDSLERLSHRVDVMPMQWEKKDYWYTPETLRKLEGIRGAAKRLSLNRSKAGRAVLLAIGLAARPCSRADQRSPKPFISRKARLHRGGVHYDPMRFIKQIVEELASLHGCRTSRCSTVHNVDFTKVDARVQELLKCSHVITSPPYVNAQDYFRNSKLELYLLEGLLPFSIDRVIGRFIGTERRLSADLLEDEGADRRRALIPKLKLLEKRKVMQATVLHRYLSDMEMAIERVANILPSGGVLVIVCGDNLIGGHRIATWRVLNTIIEQRGFKLFDQFGDEIKNRSVAPTRSGHKGLIKQEIVSAFRRSGS